MNIAFQFSIVGKQIALVGKTAVLVRLTKYSFYNLAIWKVLGQIAIFKDSTVDVQISRFNRFFLRLTTEITLI